MIFNFMDLSLKLINDCNASRELMHCKLDLIQTPLVLTTDFFKKFKTFMLLSHQINWSF